MQKYINNVAITNSAGQLRAISGALITVTNLDGSAATIYANNGGAPLTDPLLSDATGYFEFYAADGRYTITISKVGITTIAITDVLLEDPVDGSGALSGDDGSSLVGHIASGIGATATTVQAKLREMVSLTDRSTIVADGTDQTAAIVAYLGTLAADYEGIIYAPYNLKFNFTTVCTAMPTNAVFRDESGVNAWNTGGYKQQVVGYTDRGKADGTIDTQFRLSSGHNPSLILDNRGTAGSTSAANGIAAVIWGRGQLTKQATQEGVRTLARQEWSKNPGFDQWVYTWRREMPWEARDWEYWYTGKTYAIGDTIRSSNGGAYMATTAGVAGATEPSWAKGLTQSDGAVSWRCINRTVDQSIMVLNENGELALNTTPVAGVVFYGKASTDSDGAAIIITEGNGISKRAELRMLATNGAGTVITATPRIRVESDGFWYLRDSALSRNLLLAGDTLGLRLGVYGHTETVATASDTTPSVLNCGCLIFTNAVATNVTNFDDSVNTQEVNLYFETGNTTLVHSAGVLVLKGAVNVTPAAGSYITIKKNSRSTAWVEKSRSF